MSMFLGIDAAASGLTAASYGSAITIISRIQETQMMLAKKKNTVPIREIR